MLNSEMALRFLLLASLALAFAVDFPPASAATNAPAGNPAVQQLIENFSAHGQNLEPGSSPLSPRDSLARFRPPSDLQFELVTAEPDVRQPVNMNFDERGRLWVVQYLQYPFPAGLKVVKYDEYLRAVFDHTPAAPPHHVPGADKITIYEDRDGDGYFESHHDFLTGLNIATSALPGRGGVYVLNPPYLLFYPDKNHDDIPDSDPEVLLSGFGLEDTHAVANSLTWGPDGWIYGAQGSTCTAAVQGIHFLGQAVWRFHPQTRRFELFAEGGGNTFCVEFDSKGRLYSGHNGDGTRGFHYVQGGYYLKTWGKHGPLTNPNAFGFFKAMELDGYRARFSHSFAINEGGTLPSKYDGQIVASIPLHNRIEFSQLIPQGTTFKTKDSAAIDSSDRWFRPVDTKLGPDGAIYFADWYDIRLTHLDPRDTWDKSNGRIYRLTRPGAPRIPAFDLAKLSSDDLAGFLTHSNRWFRQQALRIFGDRRDPAIVPKLTRLLESQTGQPALEALWAVNLSSGFSDSLALRQLSHADPFVRLWTVRLLGDAQKVSPQIAGGLAQLAHSETNAEVRSQLACSARRLPADDAIPILDQLLRHAEDASDPHLPLLLWWAIEKHSVTAREKVLSLLNTTDHWASPLVSREILPRLARRYFAEQSPAGTEAIRRLLSAAPNSEKGARLVTEIAETAKTMAAPALPENLRTLVQNLGDPADARLNLAKLQLGCSNLAPFALRILANKQSPRDLRTEYIALAGQRLLDHAIPALLNLLADASDTPSARKSAVAALQNFDSPAVAIEVLNRYEKLASAPDVRSAAIELLSKRKSWALALLHALDAGTVPLGHLPPSSVDRLRLYSDPQITALVARHWPIRSNSAEKETRIREVKKLLAAEKGDAARGREIFSTLCGNCHKLFDQGKSIGPELTGYERSNTDFLLLSIIDPSLAIREEFTDFRLEKKDGLLLTGFIVERTPTSVTLEDPAQGRLIVSRSEIKSLEAVPISRMPEGLLDALSPTQTRDLFGYLQSTATK